MLEYVNSDLYHEVVELCVNAGMTIRYVTQSEMRSDDLRPGITLAYTDDDNYGSVISMPDNDDAFEGCDSEYPARTLAHELAHHIVCEFTKPAREYSQIKLEDDSMHYSEFQYPNRHFFIENQCDIVALYLVELAKLNQLAKRMRLFDGNK
jgi:hypothetical protein